MGILEMGCVVGLEGARGVDLGVHARSVSDSSAMFGR